MATVLRFDGVNDYISTPSFSLVDGSVLEVRFRILTNQTFAFVSAGPSAVNAYVRWNGSTLRARGNQTGPSVNVPGGVNLADGNWHVVQLHVGASTHRFNVDGNDSANVSGDVRTSLHNTLGAFFNSYFDGDIDYIKIDNSGVPYRDWDANSSPTGTGTTTLTDTVAASDGTGVNFRTDGLQWITIGGGSDQDLTPSGILSEEAFGTPTVTQNLVLSPSGIVSEEAVGSHLVQPGGLVLNPSGILSEEALGAPTVTPAGSTLFPSGILSEEAVGTVFLSFLQIINAGDIPSAENFGKVTVSDGSSVIIPPEIRKNLTQIGIFLREDPRFLAVHTNEILKEWLIYEGIEDRALPEMFYEYLLQLGHEGTINDKMDRWSRS